MTQPTKFGYMEYADIGQPNHIIDGQKFIGEGRYNDYYFVTTENVVTSEPNIGLLPPSPYSGDTPLPKDVKPLLKEITKEVLFWKMAKT
jgi:hypothetical protein|tara:strand:- start:36 stop:302 length:267 start_codon:yes stop_codon:yes gene_type:complete